MRRIAKEYRYPLRLPIEDEPQIAELVKKSGQSINSVLVLCIRKGLPLASKALGHSSGRLTTVDPLPEAVLERIYGERDELKGITAEQLLGFQSQTEPE
jgi:hypothetical protein